MWYDYSIWMSNTETNLVKANTYLLLDVQQMLFNVELLFNYFNLGSFLIIYLITPQFLCAHNTALVSIFASLLVYTWVTRG